MIIRNFEEFETIVKPREEEFVQEHFLIDFSNKYGASIIKLFPPFGDGKWEVAVTKNGDLCYDSQVTNDVIQGLDEKEVAEVLRKIAGLKNEE